MARDPNVVSMTMSHIRGKDTGIELKLRKALSEKGIRYRLYSSRVFGHPDLVLPQYKIAVFVDSEFWHGYRFEENREKIKTNVAYWIPKIERNIARDAEVNAELKLQGYLVLRFWGQRIEKELPSVVEEIQAAIEKRKQIREKIQGIKVFTTLGYLKRGDTYLMLHRNKKKNDENEGKWIGVGGHIEPGESILGCLKREVKEETGYTVKKARYLGKIDFLNDRYPCERMYLYAVPEFEGEERVCDEGDLAWVNKNDIMNLPLWEGDKAFLPLLESEEKSPFHLILLYSGYDLTEVLGLAYPPEKQKKEIRRRA